MGVRVKGLGVKVETMKIQLLEHVSEANYNHKNRIFFQKWVFGRKVWVLETKASYPLSLSLYNTNVTLTRSQRVLNWFLPSLHVLQLTAFRVVRSRSVQSGCLPCVPRGVFEYVGSYRVVVLHWNDQVKSDTLINAFRWH